MFFNLQSNKHAILRLNNLLCKRCSLFLTIRMSLQIHETQGYVSMYPSNKYKNRKVSTTKSASGTQTTIRPNRISHPVFSNVNTDELRSIPDNIRTFATLIRWLVCHLGCLSRVLSLFVCLSVCLSDTLPVFVKPWRHLGHINSGPPHCSFPVIYILLEAARLRTEERNIWIRFYHGALAFIWFLRFLSSSSPYPTNCEWAVCSICVVLLIDIRM